MTAKILQFPTKPAVSAELAAALQDGGTEAIQIVLNAALASQDLRTVNFCMRLLLAMRAEIPEE